MSDINKFRNNRKILLNKHKCCQKCGRTIDLEVHHIIPRSKGGTDDLENLQVLCGICHNDIHRYNKSELTKIGMEKAKHKQNEVLISKLDFYIELQKLLNTEEIPTVNDILDIINNLPIKGSKELKEELQAQGMEGK